MGLGLDAFDRAGASGARVVNASLGGVGDDYLAALVADTVSQYPNTLYVVAAGNENTNLEPTATVYLPCETPAPNVLCVGASTYTDSRASFSNYGSTAVDVFAPGLNIESTTFDGAYDYMSGTSMATPNTVGVAALLFGQEPALTGAQARQRLINSADPVPGLPSVAGGRVNAQRALSETDGGGDAGPPAPIAPPPAPVVPPTGGDVQPQPLHLVSLKTSIHHRVVTVRVRTSGSASVRVSAQRRTCRRGTCAWKTKAARSITSTPIGVAMLRLAGRYRLRVSAGSAFTSDKTIIVRR